MNEPTATTDSVVIERIFHAPIATMWSMWTDAAHFAAWYGPMGATIPTAEMDVTVGGRRLICMEMAMPDRTMRMWFTGEYFEIDEPHRLVYSESMSDEDGHPQPTPTGHPANTVVTVEFEALDDARTRIVLTHAGIPADSPGATGWTMAFDKLAEHLADR